MEIETVADDAIKKEANRYFTCKVIVNLVFLLLGAVFVGFFLSNMQKEVALTKQADDNAVMLTEVVELLDGNAAIADELTRIYHAGNQDTLDVLHQVLHNGLVADIIDDDDVTRSAAIADLAERTGAEYFFVLLEDSTMVLTPREDFYGKNLVELGLLTPQNVTLLMEGTRAADGTVTPVRETNASGDYFFYSSPAVFEGDAYMVILGAECSVLDTQLASLNDVGAILGQVTLANDGFFFAVDPRTETFVYYENNGTILTGQDARSHGLTVAAMQDGYEGIQTIDGVEYFCSSRTTEGRVVISAVASVKSVFHANNMVLVWSVGSYLLVMLLCLAYAVFLRNDFVLNRTETKTRRLFTFRNTDVLFDKTIGAKTAPLMLMGVLVVFGLTYYAQRMLAIDDAVTDSKVAISEIGARYEDSQETRQTVAAYYNDRFLAKAKLIAYLLEEDPSVLNAPTERQYTEYDAQGNRSFVYDDEGNILRSVMASTYLQDLCMANDLGSIFVFDEVGHTIATSSETWYFTVGTDPSDSSYEFRKVLDGKVDVLAQGVREDGESGVFQFFGVAFNYYTTVDEDGNTRYVSRYDYRASLEEGYAGAPVHPHRSMVQVGLMPSLIYKLQETTDPDYIFSADTLGEGAVVAFTSDAEHRVVYAPDVASVGKTAAELGLSDKFFGGEYYGFNTVNGVNYFTYCSYFDGYYLATAIPAAEVNRGCVLVALVSALVSFLVTILLLLTVTLTSRKEEELYLAVTEEFRALRNKPVFRNLLSSDHFTNTVEASERWSSRILPWSLRSPEQKLLLVVEIVIAVIVIGILVAVAMVDSNASGDSLLRYVISGNWERGVNIFALSACVLLFVVVMVGVQLLGIPMRLVTEIMGAKAETIGHLLMSVFRYGGALVVLFYGLYMLGVDASGLLASAGILSLVIGLGAQSLIRDIIAGIFIVFEGEFQVGDIVTIGDFRGTVLDIGLRTTKIKGLSNNIKIVNNSEITGVLNMTNQDSFALVDVGISYAADLEAVEKVLAEELPRMEGAIPGLIGAPEYLGVDDLTGSSVNLRFLANANESDIFAVRRAVRRAIYLALTKHGVTIPYNTVTISNLRADARVVEVPSVERMEFSFNDGER